MRTVITGGAGFIGGHLAEELLRRGDDVVVFDDLSTGSLGNLLTIAHDPRLHIIKGSILDKPLVMRVIDGADRVFHLAAAVGVKVIVEDPLRSLRTNIHGTENVLNAALAADATLLLVSTGEIYGKNVTPGLSEDADRVLGSASKSRWTYAAAKSIDEAFGLAYRSEYGLDVVIVRPFNTVGPRQTGRYGMVVPNLVGQALRGEPLTVFGDGRQSRCFAYVGDVVPGMIALAETPAAYGRAVNLGTTNEITILGLAQRVIDVLGSRSAISFVPYELAYVDGYEDMRRRVPDIRLARELVGFDPTTSLDDIIRAVAAVPGSNANEAMASPVRSPAGTTAPAPSHIPAVA
ncbi:NAD-dependent epimerase/dehydratase family protein [Parafrigoribacterium humi]|uniref:NAD-dependent epimerase/dehydratase family protein n=1 Tax=Parafrigoribacterium humi TaxID=3144664 RepID=UPI0032F08450